MGPATANIETLKELIKTGVNVARINMSHGTHEAHKEMIENIRKASAELNENIGILVDLQGPKIRVDKLPENLKLKDGSEWVIGPTSKQNDYPEYKDCYIPTIYEKLVEDCHDGARILFDDGLIMAEATTRDRDVYKIKVIVGGELKSNKGINLPDCEVSAPAFTEKDQEDLMFAIGLDIDFIALSFVRRKEDILTVKKILHQYKLHIPIISKIEKPQAIDNLDEILSVTDMIMVARGDMGVEVGNHLVPAMQKKIITRCNEKHIPVITATQMLESMTTNPNPTRAEASDVANAVWDGTDAVMLSGETSVGKYPIETVRMMDSIVFEAERAPKERPFLRHMDLSSVNASVMVAASMIAEKVHAKRIIAVTESGSSCQKISAFRPKTMVSGITNSIQTARRMALYWGVKPFYLPEFDEDNFDFQKDVINRVKENYGLANGDKLVITRGDGAFFSRGSSNSVKVEIINDRPRVLGSSEVVEEESDKKKRIQLDVSICGSCQACVSICPHDVWVVSDSEMRKTSIDPSKVKDCQMDMECVEACPTGAIEIIPTTF